MGGVSGQRSAAEVKVKEVKVGAWLNRFRFARGPDAPFRRVGIQEGEPLRSVQCWVCLFVQTLRRSGALSSQSNHGTSVIFRRISPTSVPLIVPLTITLARPRYGMEMLEYLCFFYCRWGRPSVEPPRACHFCSVVATECQNAGWDAGTGSAPLTSRR